jgi:hypothetical protein
VYQTSQFLGVFLGGLLGGWLYGLGGATAVFTASALVLGGWLVLVASAPPLPQYDSRQCAVTVSGVDEARRLAERLQAVPGVVEATVIPERGMAQLVLDRRRLDEAVLEQALAVR